MITESREQVMRREPGYRDLAERLGDFDEVEKTLSAEKAVEQAARCLNCGTPFCHGYACPLGNVVPEINELVVEKRWEEALEILFSTHPFPEFTARVCPALCEGSCVCGINDEPVTIRQIEKLIVEKGFTEGWIKPRPPRRRRKEKVAVVGSGPAGLAAADRLNKMGFPVTVYEKDLYPGGILRYGIPNFKLDKKIVDRRIDLMKKEGIAFECGIVVGSDISYNYLKRHFTVLLLAGGARLSRDLNIPGRELTGIYPAMAFLSAQNKRVIGEPLFAEEDITARGKNVVIIGGGDTGSDCLGTALRQGAAKVYQIEIMPRAPEIRPSDNLWPLWPRVDRVSSSHREGGIRRWCVDTKSFEGDEKGEVKRLHCVEVEWVKKDGRFIPVENEASNFTLDADLVLLALGFLGPGKDPLAEALRLERDARSNIAVDRGHMTSTAGVFSAGDMASGQSLVVRAAADGVQAAEGINAYLRL